MQDQLYQKDFFNKDDPNDSLVTISMQVESFNAMGDFDVICIQGDCEGFWIDNKFSR